MLALYSVLGVGVTVPYRTEPNKKESSENTYIRTGTQPLIYPLDHLPDRSPIWIIAVCIFAVSKVHGLHTWARIVRGSHERHLAPSEPDSEMIVLDSCREQGSTKVCAPQLPCLCQRGEDASVASEACLWEVWRTTAVLCTGRMGRVGESRCEIRASRIPLDTIPTQWPLLLHAFAPHNP